MMLLVAIVIGAKAETASLNALSEGTTSFKTGDTGYHQWGSATDKNKVIYDTDNCIMMWSNGNKLSQDATGLKIGNSSKKSAFVFKVASASDISVDIAYNGSDMTAYLCYLGETADVLTDPNSMDNPTDALDSKSITSATSSATLSVKDGNPGYYMVFGTLRFCASSITVTATTPSTDPKITASNASVTATESGVAATVEVPVTGAYLTGSTLTATLSGAPAGMSVALDQNAISAGAISATATVSYTATENANGTATLTFSDGTTTKDVTITYVSKVETVELQSVSEETVWDFSKLTVNKSSANYNSKDDAIKLDDTTSPKNTDEIVYTNYDGTDFTIGTDFDGSSIAFTGQYPIRKNSFSQNGTIKIKPSVAGTIIVKFTDTGSSASKTAVKRYLVVNGEQTEYWTSRENNGDEPYDAQLNVTTDEISVPAGEVTITGSSAICVSYVKFTPAAAPTTETITIPSDGVLTYVTKNDLDFSTINGAFKAYVPTSVNEAKTSVATAEVTSVPAGTALLLKGAEGSYDVEIAESATAPAANLFLVSDGNVQGADNIFAYSKSALKFKKVASTVTIPAGKCYLTIAGVSGDALDLDFDGEATAVDAIAEADEAEAAPVKVIKNGKLYIGNFNVAGQQVK